MLIDKNYLGALEEFRSIADEQRQRNGAADENGFQLQNVDWCEYVVYVATEIDKAKEQLFQLEKRLKWGDKIIADRAINILSGIKSDVFLTDEESK